RFAPDQMTSTEHGREPAATDPVAEPPEKRLWRFLIGRPRSLEDRSLFHRLSLIPFLAWIGLGADGLSSSAYGPEEAFKQLGEHAYLAVALAAMMITTILLISTAYSRIIEEFPHGGGGGGRALQPRAAPVPSAQAAVRGAGARGPDDDQHPRRARVDPGAGADL